MIFCELVGNFLKILRNFENFGAFVPFMVCFEFGCTLGLVQPKLTTKSDWLVRQIQAGISGSGQKLLRCTVRVGSGSDWFRVPGSTCL